MSPKEVLGFSCECLGEGRWQIVAFGKVDEICSGWAFTTVPDLSSTWRFIRHEKS
jgi:hypothetical protein